MSSSLSTLSFRHFFTALIAKTFNAAGLSQKNIAKFFLCFSVSLVLTACGGGGGDATDPVVTTPVVTGSTISGTAATGAAISGQVFIYGSAGEHESFPIDASGHYEIDVSNLTAPFIIIAKPDAAAKPWQYSFASQAGVVANVTPLTTLALYLAYGEIDFSNLLADLTAGSLGFTESDLVAAQTSIKSKFSAKISELGLDPAFDFFSMVFNTNGAGVDGLLDYLTIDIDMAGTGDISINGTVYDFSPAAGGDTGSTPTNLGSLTDTGFYQTLIANPTFDPKTYEEVGGTNFTWADEDTLEALTVISAPDDASKAWSVTYHNGWTTVVELEFRDTIYPGILDGVAITDQSVTFTNFTFVDAQGENAVILNGTLYRQ